MNTHQVSLFFIFLYFFITLNFCSSDHADTSTTHYTRYVSINCGSTGTFSAHNGRKWLGDETKASPLLQLKGLSTTSTAVGFTWTSADPVPYKTARVSRSQFSYAFQVNPGQKTIRLHFNPSAYKGFNRLKDLFTVEAGYFTLLSNFSASVTANALRENFLTKEFCLNIDDKDQLLEITFFAETTQSKDAYAFINGIEIISVPAGLSYFQGGSNGIQVVGENTLVSIDKSIALEIISRLNINQDFDSSGDGSDGVFRMSVTIPLQEASNGNNVSLKVPVDVGFRYLVRHHFSKPGLTMAETGGLKFKVIINGMIANTKTEMVVKERDDGIIPWYGDYVVMMSGRKVEGRRDLLIRLQSNEEFMNGPLKGFEILKMSNPDNSLASPIPMPSSQDSTSRTFQILLKVLGRGNVIATVAITIICLVIIAVYMLTEIWEASSSEEGNKPSARAERLCRHFSLSEMQSATGNFNDMIGRGGYGKVYKGIIDKGKNTVAVKRLKPDSSQGEGEFLTEIETLSELRHINLVSLIGYCSEGRERILVYEYMARGTLGDHLYNFARRGIDASSLTWKQRLNICVGAARGLDYLHTGHRVIHRDVNSSNILLDDNFVPKVSDFGLAKAESRSKKQSHISTKVKGTFGYLDPSYYTTRRLTNKSDTYSLGVVLLEVLCGRPAVDSEVSDEERILTKWALYKISKGEVDQIVASSLRDEILPNSLKTFVEIIERCLLDEPKNRPTMSEIVLQLEFALYQQDNNQNVGANEITSAPNRTCLSITPPPTVDFINTQNLTPSPSQQTNKKVVTSDLIYGRNHKGKSPRHKSSRLWPWDPLFWNRAKPSKKQYTLSLSDVNLPKFDWDDIAAATNNLSASNIVAFCGQGRAVYKAVLPSGKAVAVKRRSAASAAEGQKEFKNEINVLPNLLHRNIIKLLGYCINGEELYLVHEFMENTILDYFIGKQQQQNFQWGVRFQIIMGIARGLVYLHHDSGLRIIHRDLTRKSIQLDPKMNPKICDFELARSMAESQSEEEMDSPVEDHRMHRNISVKTDVKSFGIIMLEIVSGRKAVDSNLEHVLLVEHAWKLWNEMRPMELVDETLQESAFGEDEAARCIQENPDHRPSMSSVIKMLEGNERIMLPQTAIEE